MKNDTKLYALLIGIDAYGKEALGGLARRAGNDATFGTLVFDLPALPATGWSEEGDSVGPLYHYLKQRSNSDKLEFHILHFSGHGSFVPPDFVNICGDITRDTVARVFSEPERLFRMTALGFEQFVAEIYRGLGFEVRSTKQSHDGGVDLYLERNLNGMVHRYVVQCKYREAPKRKVGVSAARELLGTLVDKAATAGILVTNYLFSSATERFIESHSTRLFGANRESLLHLMAEYLVATAA